MSLGGQQTPYNQASGLVDRFIGNAYQIVKDVQAHLTEIKYLANHLTELRPREVEFRGNDVGQVVEWKYTDAATWSTLVSYAQISEYSVEQVVIIAAQVEQTRDETLQIKTDVQALFDDFDEYVQNQFATKVAAILDNGIPPYDPLKAYAAGKFASHEGELYLSKVATQGVEPPGADWIPYGNGKLIVSAVGNPTLTVAESRFGQLVFAGILTENSTVYLDASIPRSWIITNSTSGNYTLTVRTATGSGVAIAQGHSERVYTDGVNVLSLGVSAGLGAVIKNAGGQALATISSEGLLTVSDLTVLDDLIVGGDLQVTGNIGVTAVVAESVEAESISSPNDIVGGTGTTGQATEEIRGTSRIADAPTVTAGTSDEEVITPKKLREQGRFQRTFTSAQIDIVSGAGGTLPHSLGAAPRLVTARLVCLVANSGYSVGDVIPIHIGAQDISAGYGMSVVATATDIKYRFGSDNTVFFLNNFSTGVVFAATNANFKLVLEAFN